MTTPRIEIDLGKISHNATKLREMYASKGIGIIGVTKVVCGDPAVADVLVRTGIETLADSRLENIKRMRQAGVQARFVLLRSPAPSQAESAVKYADISFNTELSVIEALSGIAVKTGVTHKIILMVEMGDLREGLLPGVLRRPLSRSLARVESSWPASGQIWRVLGESSRTRRTSIIFHHSLETSKRSLA